MKLSHTLGATFTALTFATSTFAADQSIIVQSTTSTANSGLYDHLLPLFEDNRQKLCLE